MPNSTKKQHINVDRELSDRFDYVYPRLKHIFVARSMELALQDKNYFEEVFFNKLFLEVK